MLNLLSWTRSAVIRGLVVVATGLIVVTVAYSLWRQTPVNEATAQSRLVSVVPTGATQRAVNDDFGGNEGIRILESTAAVSGISADPIWVARIAASTGISEQAVAAYATASLRAAEEFPDCGLGWNTLAAIGHVESAHGTINGSHLDDTGTATPGIIGPALDGQGYKAIADSDGGILDGDTVWDRAVGPMQFIPQTWELYGRDSNGDGIADPQHIADAALSAAVLLCTVGGDLTVDDNWIAAVNAYNQSVAYNHEIVDAADHYASFN